MATPSDVDVLAAFPAAAIDRDNVEHFRGRLERRLLLNRCADCGLWHQPPRPVCPRCWSVNLQAIPVTGKGAVALLTVLHLGSPVAGVDYAAGYPVAAVELDEQPGLRFTATVVDCPPELLRIGLPVELTWLDRAGEPTPAFRPRTTAGDAGRPPIIRNSLR